MSPTDKLPEGQNAPSRAAPAAPEDAVSPAAIAEGQVRAVDQKIAAVERATSGSIVDRQAAVDQLAAAADQNTPSGSGTDQANSLSGGWGAVSGVGDLFEKISKAFGDIGKKFSEWLKDVMGDKEKDEIPQVSTSQASMPSSAPTKTESPQAVVQKTVKKTVDHAVKHAEAAVQKAKDVIYKLVDLLNPKAPYITFLGNKTPRKTSNYGKREDPMKHGHDQFHKGVDITLAAGNEDIGEPVVATRPLKVAYTDTTSGGGNIVAVVDPAHPDIVIPLLHLQSLNNRVAGDSIQPGEVIARIGNTGARSTGAHLHVEAKRNGENIDPTPYLGLA